MEMNSQNKKYKWLLHTLNVFNSLSCHRNADSNYLKILPPLVRMTMIRIEMQTNAGLDEKGSPNLLFVGVLTSAAILEVILEISQKTRNRTAK